jgi:quercetin dioxygenase-like cupin family protein
MDLRLKITRRANVLLALVLLGTFSLSLADDEATTLDNAQLEQLWRVLEKTTLSNHNDIEVKVREHEYPGGWKAPTHRHLGDLFIYVLDGEFEVITKTDGKTVYTVGDTFIMRPGVNMDARNNSDSEVLKILVFQVGKPDDPFLVLIE